MHNANIHQMQTEKLFGFTILEGAQDSTTHSHKSTHATANMHDTFSRHVRICTISSMHTNQHIEPQTCTARCRVTYECAHDQACATTNACNRKHARRVVVSRMNVHTIKHAQRPMRATANMHGALSCHVGMCTRSSMHNNQRMQPQTCNECAQEQACIATWRLGREPSVGQVEWVWRMSMWGGRVGWGGKWWLFEYECQSAPPAEKQRPYIYICILSCFKMDFGILRFSHRPPMRPLS
jgi:hypothetical protein